MENKDESHARDQARMQIDSIMDMVDALVKAEACEEASEHCTHDAQEAHDSADECREMIREDALDVQVRSGWRSIGSDACDTEYSVLLCTGGPAVRIRGELRDGAPAQASVEYQDWGTPWTNYPMTHGEQAACIKYAEQFYFGE